MNNVPQALQQLAQPTKSIWPFDQLSELWKAISPHLSPLSNIVSMLNNHVSMTNSGVSMASTLHSMLKGLLRRRLRPWKPRRKTGSRR